MTARPSTAHSSPVTLFRLLVIVNVVLMAAAILAYGEPFLFWQYPLSDLGATVTENGLPNAWSFVLFLLDMLISSSIMATYAYQTRAQLITVHDRWQLLLGSGATVGFIITAYPPNLNDPIHIAGATLMVVSLWLLGILFLERYRKTSPGRGLVGHLILHGPLFVYAALFFLGIPEKQIAQKFAFVSLLVILALVTQPYRPPVRQPATPFPTD